MDVTELAGPLPLLLSDSAGHFHVVAETARIVSAIGTPLVVVAVVGKIRTGKSFLMNRLAGSNTGFTLGSTIKSHTKGIWVWPRSHPLDKKRHLLLLDTEGLGEVDQEGNTDNEHDTWLFIMTVLLSSMLVYNTTGILSRDGLEHLRFVLNLTEHLRTDARHNAHEPGSDFATYFPALVLCLRDFTMKLEVNGDACTPDGYMEHFLHSRVEEPQNDGVNEQRRLLCQYFKERKCFMFPKPTDLRSLLNLQKLPDDRLDEVFMETANTFTAYTIRTARLKHIRGAVFTGQTLVRLVEEYVDAERRGAVPCIETALRAVVTVANREAAQAALGLYAARMAHANLELPLPMQLLNGYHQEAAEPAIRLFHDRSVLDRDHMQEKELLVELTREYARLVTRNSEVSWQRCERRLLQLYQPVRAKVDRQELHKPGGYRKFRALVDKVHEDYYEGGQLREEEMENVYKEFMDRRDMDGKVILRADRNVTDAEKSQIATDERNKRQERDRRAIAERHFQNQVKTQALKNDTQVAEEAFVKKSRSVELLISEDLEEERTQHAHMLSKFLYQLEPLLEEALNMFLLQRLSP